MNRSRRFERDYACKRRSFYTRTAQETAVVICTSFGQFLKMKVNQIS